MTVSGFAGGVWAIAGRELRSLFVTPLAYVVGTLFLLLQGYSFALLLSILNDPLAAPGPVMQYYFGGSFFIFWLPVMFLCSALGMRLVAEERGRGTLEALLTAPVSPAQIVMGKFLGALAFYLALWAPTGVFYVLLAGAAVQPDPGPVAAGYLGTTLVGASFIAVGLLASAVSRTQLGAAISTFVACSIALLAGLLAEHVRSEWIAEAIAATSLLAMMQELSQGIVDGRWLWIHGAAVVTALALAIVAVDPRRNRERAIRVALIAITAAHVALFASRHSGRGDWTRAKLYSVSERARFVLVELPRLARVTVVVPSTLGAGRPSPLHRELDEVLRRMTAVTSMLDVTMIDPDRDRQRAESLIRDFGLGGRELADGVVLFRSGHGAGLRRAHLLPTDLVTYATTADVQTTGPRVQSFRGEEAILRKLAEVTEPRQPVVCYTQGHGEPEPDNLEPFGGYAHLHDMLRAENLDLQPAQLDDTDGLDGCDVVMVAGPQGRLPKAHVDAIGRFAGAGGHLLILSGAVVMRQRGELAQHGLEPLLREYGVAFGDRVVLDPHAMPGATPLLSFTIDDGWGDHAAVRSLAGRAVSFILARELDVSEPAATLVHTTEDGWAEADIGGLSRGDPLTADPDVDRLGPLPVAAAAERGGSKLVVIASDQLALNANLRADIVYDHGRDLILNVVGWLVEPHSHVGVRAREREHVKLVLQPHQLRNMALVCLLGIPGFVVALGLLVLWRRRVP